MLARIYENKGLIQSLKLRIIATSLIRETNILMTKNKQEMERSREEANYCGLLYFLSLCQSSRCGEK